jgi:hypothetical protein
MRIHDEDDEAPLSPAAERLRRKLIRLLVVSGGIMALGFIAVFAAIVYKLGEGGRGAAEQLSAESPLQADVIIPAGYRIVAIALDGERALLTLEAPNGSSELLLIDLESGAVVGRYDLMAE